MPDRLLETYDFNFIINGHERIVGTQEHLKVYKTFIDDMKQTLLSVVQSEAFLAVGKEAEERYAPASMHYIYKDSITFAADACAVKMMQKWQGILRNAALNMVENCQTMFMHLIILDP